LLNQQFGFYSDTAIRMPLNCDWH